MTIDVKYSLEKEVENYLDSLYSFKWYKHGRDNIQNDLLKPFPDNFKNGLLKAKDKKEARKVITNFISPYLPNRKKSYKQLSGIIQKEWTAKKTDIIRQLEDVYGERFPFKKITIYLSSIPICPYNYKEKWIMLCANTTVDQQIDIIRHELSHFMFYYYYPIEKLSLDKSQYELLKEALTILINKDEKGYPKEQKIRKWLSKQKGTIKEILSGREWRNYL